MDDPTKDTIPRSAVEYCLRKETVSTNPEKYKTHEKFIDYMNDPDISEFGHWMHSNGFNCALTAISVDLKKIPSVTPSSQPDLDEWCTDCTEYDQERHCCPRWSRVIRQTVDDVEQNRWIPCKTRKPEKSGLYLVTKQQKTGEIQLATAHYNTAFDEWSGNGNFKKVLAWMTLPSPWKGVQDGD